MKKLLLFTLATTMFIACDPKEDSTPNQTNTEVAARLKGSDYMLFSETKAPCTGTECIQTYKLTSTNLYEDLNHADLDGTHNWSAMSQAQFEEASRIMDYMPIAFTSIPSQDFKCFDCAEGSKVEVILSYQELYRRWSSSKTGTSTSLVFSALGAVITNKMKSL